MTRTTSNVNATCPNCGSDLKIKAPNPAKAIALTYIDGPGNPPTEDDARLRHIANWLDRIDDEADAEMASSGRSHRIGRPVQADLRRIAERLGDAIALGDA